MKVVIDIPPQTWALVKEGQIPVRAYECIVKGTPLRCVLDEIRCEIDQYTYRDTHGKKVIFRERLNHILNKAESEESNDKK